MAKFSAEQIAERKKALDEAEAAVIANNTPETVAAHRKALDEHNVAVNPVGGVVEEEAVVEEKPAEEPAE